MVLVVIFALAALFFLFKGLFSLGGAVQSKQLENEISKARVEIISLLEDDKKITAKETFILYQKRIDDFCEINNIKFADKAEKIRFAHEFEKWGSGIFTKLTATPAIDNKVIRELTELVKEERIEKEFSDSIQGNSISRAVEHLIIVDIKIRESIAFWLCLLCWITETTAIETENNVIEPIELIKCFYPNEKHVLEAVHEVLLFKGPEREIAVLGAANRIKRLNDDLMHQFLTINIFIFRQIDFNELNSKQLEREKQLLYWVTNTLFPDIYRSTFKAPQ